MGQAAKKRVKEPLTLEEEREKVMRELEILGNRADAISKMAEVRKKRLKELMNQLGHRNNTNDYGQCFFQAKRTVSVNHALAKKLPKKILLEGFKPTVAMVDACAKKGTDLKGAVTVGAYESFTYSRPKGKEAEARRKEAIARSMQEAEEKVSAIMERI